MLKLETPSIKINVVQKASPYCFVCLFVWFLLTLPGVSWEVVWKDLVSWLHTSCLGGSTCQPSPSLLGSCCVMGDITGGWESVTTKLGRGGDPPAKDYDLKEEVFRCFSAPLSEWLSDYIWFVLHTASCDPVKCWQKPSSVSGGWCNGRSGVDLVDGVKHTLLL